MAKKRGRIKVKKRKQKPDYLEKKITNLLKAKKDNHPYNRKNEIIKLISIVLIFIVLSFLIYRFFFKIEKCSDEVCFSNALISCSRAQLINDDSESTWSYTILGKRSGKCQVEVKLLQIKRGKLDIEEAEGKTMTCSLPIRTITLPGENLELCSGELKESLQDLVIKKMHSYILENLGEINEELKGLTIKDLTKVI